MDPEKEKTLLELLNMIIKESSLTIANSKDLSDESKLIPIIRIM